MGFENIPKHEKNDKEGRIAVLTQEINKLADELFGYNKQLEAARKNKSGDQQIRQMVQKNMSADINKTRNEIIKREQEKTRLESELNVTVPTRDPEVIKKEIADIEKQIEICEDTIAALEKKQNSAKSNDEFDDYSKEISDQVYGKGLYEKRRDALLIELYP